MAKNIQEYIKNCAMCRQVKPTRHLPYGEFQSLPFPMKPRQDWIMDFITGLPLSLQRDSKFDVILVVVNKFTKYSIYLPAREGWDADTLADVLIEAIFIKYGMPVFFTSNRGLFFTLHVWLHFCYYFRIHLGYSITFHPQIDSQTEHQNQMLEQYLRSYVNYQQDNWVYWLPLAEYAYNNSVHTTTGQSPFQAMFGEKFWWEDVI